MRQFTPFLIAGGLFTLFIGVLMFVGYDKIEGRERAVVQDWNEGVLPTLWSHGTHFYIPATTTPYIYHIGTQKFIMGNPEVYGDAEQPHFPAFKITTGGSGKEQPATFSITLQFHLDETKLIVLHSKAAKQYRTQIIKPALTRIVSDLATTQTVLEFYSGEGRVKLQKDIEDAIRLHPSLSEVGIVVDTLVIDQIKLDEEYVNEITGRQLATQKKLRAIEETKANLEVAKRDEAAALASKLTKIVAAEAAKEERIRAAEAAKEEIKLAAQASRFSKEQDAKGLLAEGLAQARVDNERKVARYSGVSGARQAQVEINEARVKMFSNFTFTGFLPEKAALTLIGPGSPPVVPTVNAASKLE